MVLLDVGETPILNITNISIVAEFNIMLGEDVDHMEQFTVNKPVIIHIPPNLCYCPINFRVVNKPILCQDAYQNGIRGKTLARKRPDGSRYFEFTGDGIAQ